VLDPEPPSSDDGGAPLRRPAPPRSWRDRLGELADATGTSPTRIALGGLAAAVALAAALWLLRSPPDPPEASLPFSSTTAAAAPTTTAPARLVVDVAGAVVAPGLHELAAGARVADAIDAAGGLTARADRARINLAAPVVDGARIYVPVAGEEPPPVAVGEPAGSPGSVTTGPVNLNTADAAALETLPGVGPATAAAILEQRAKVGAFTSVDQLLDVPGIGDAKLAALRDLVTV
jgi:competence protein ComEA